VNEMPRKEQSVIIRLGLDDTDHPEIGCTTERMNELVDIILSRIDSELIERRLVRLWPFATRRTRGNGALGAIFMIHMEEIEELYSICSGWFSELCEEIERYPETEFDPSPCLVISESEVSDEWYWTSVRGEVDCDKRMLDVQDAGCTVLVGESHWGVVGASAAISWVPGTFSSWELIAWRSEEKIGTERQVSETAVSCMGSLHPGAFVNRDPTKGRGLIAPRTPCPVLYGIRGSCSEDVERAHEWLQKRTDIEQCSCSAIHRTNQLSDDHIESSSSGTVISTPETTKGGHAMIGAITPDGRFNLVAFSEGGPVNRLLRSLIPGDQISWTGLASPDGSFHLEKLRADKTSPRITGRPICCSKTMRSKGKGQGMKCNSCGRMRHKYWLCNGMEGNYVAPIGRWVEPSPSNRRHLARPVSLMQ